MSRLGFFILSLCYFPPHGRKWNESVGSAMYRVHCPLHVSVGLALLCLYGVVCMFVLFAGVGEIVISVEID
jgi:hypothetical protein